MSTMSFSVRDVSTSLSPFDPLSVEHIASPLATIRMSSFAQNGALPRYRGRMLATANAWSCLLRQTIKWKLR